MIMSAISLDYQNFQEYFEEHKKNMRRGINTGFTASAAIMPGIIKVIDQL